MNDTIIIGIDLAKNVFQLHGMRTDGSIAFRRKLSRAKFLSFFSAHPPCVVAMEACASAHYWGREIGKLGFEVRLIAPQYVKPFVKRQKMMLLTRRRSPRQRPARPCALSQSKARKSRARRWLSKHVTC